MRRRHLVVAFVMCSACRSGPEAESWRIEVAGHTVGVESVTPTPTGWTSERVYRMRIAGDEATLRAASEWWVQDGRVRRWRSGSRDVVMETSDPWAWRTPPPPGERALFDPAIGAVRLGQVSDESGRRWFDDGEVRWWVELDGDQAVSMGANAVSITRAEEVGEWDTVDPAELLALASAGDSPRSAGRVYAALRIEGPARELVEGADERGRVEVRRPLWLEVGAGPPVALTGVPETGLAEELANEVVGMSVRDAVAALVRVIPQRMTFASEPVFDANAAMHGARGDCTEHADLLVRTLHRLGQQAAVRVGWRYREQRWVPHAWVRVTLPAAGEVDVDPTWGDRVAPSLMLALAPSLQSHPWEALGRGVGSRVWVEEAR